MKICYSLLALFFLCSCESGFLSMEEESSLSSVELQNLSLDNSYFYTNSNNMVVDYQGTATEIPTITSYLEENGANRDLLPIVTSKPAWVSNIEVRNVYYKYYIVIATAEINTSLSERMGTVVLTQSETNKTLSLQVKQESGTNIITLSVSTVATNRYEFTISTRYPVYGGNVVGSVGVNVLHEVYNDYATYQSTMGMRISNGSTSDSFVKDYNGSPIVAYHGDLKGCRFLPPITPYPLNDGFYDYVVVIAN
ncbi:hypothetical protein [Bacteroides sp. UBA939]|uniref:hypothetical protein n=1 Tax=Bacteroides sp. UBA939 TaxID=1946092 RepID=UPI0025BBA67F|nr:hypothetical protein [Bacteroides sp. UBA939]